MADETVTEVTDDKKEYMYRGQQVMLTDSERDVLLDGGITAYIERDKPQPEIKIDIKDEHKDEKEADKIAELSSKLEKFVDTYESDKNAVQQNHRKDQLLRALDEAATEHEFTKENSKAREKVEKLALQQLSVNPHADIKKLFKKEADEMSDLATAGHKARVDEKRETKEKTLTPGKGTTEKPTKERERVTTLRGYAKKNGLVEKLSAAGKDKTIEGRKEVFS